MHAHKDCTCLYAVHSPANGASLIYWSVSVKIKHYFSKGCKPEDCALVKMYVNNAGFKIPKRLALQMFYKKDYALNPCVDVNNKHNLFWWVILNENLTFIYLKAKSRRDEVWYTRYLFGRFSPTGISPLQINNIFSVHSGSTATTPPWAFSFTWFICTSLQGPGDLLGPRPRDSPSHNLCCS